MAKKYDILLYPNQENRKYALVEDDLGVVQGVRGAYQLASYVARVLLTTPGSIPSRPAEGSLLASLAGSLYDKKTLQASIVREVGNVERYIKRTQAKSGFSTPLSELLREIIVVSVTFIGDERAALRLLVVSESGESVQTELAV